jgi:predicted ester cyclase
VFGDAEVDGATAQSRAWEDTKARERQEKRPGGDTSVLADVPVGLPALTRAGKLQRRAARVGFDWPEVGPVLAKLEEELGEVRAELAVGAPRARLVDELGDLLFAAANLARHLGVDGESALRQANRKFERRFRAIETALHAAGRDLDGASLDEMEALWQAAKGDETPTAAVATTATALSAIYRDYIACLNRQDWPMLGQFVDDEVSYNGKQIGLSGYRALLENDFRAIPDLYFDVQMVMADPPHVASRLQFDCTPTGAFQGLPVDGQNVSFAENVFYAFRQAKILHVWSVIDKAAIEAQLSGAT